MTTISGFEDLRVWQESRMFVRSIRAICKQLSVRRDFAFIDQISRSARSISANIAEGSEAMTIPEYISYLGIAKRSCGETRSHLYDALDEKYISQEVFEKLCIQSKKICSMLAKFIHHLQSLNPRLKRTFSQAPQPIN